MFYGYALGDEFFLGCILIAIFLSVIIGTLKKKEQSKGTDIHFILFMTLIYYLIAQSVRGMFVLDDIRMTRYILYFCALGSLAVIINKYSFYVPNIKVLSGLIMLAGFIYLIWYLSHGAYFEMQSIAPEGLGRVQSQGKEWSGTAYAFYPLAITLPCAFIYYVVGSGANKVTSLLFVALAIYAGVYFDSRVGLICICFFIILTFVVSVDLVVKAGFVMVSIAVCLVFLLPSVLDVWTAIYIEKMSPTLGSLFESIFFLTNPRDSDFGRNAYFTAGVMTSLSGIVTLLIGDGWYVHRFTMRQALISLGSNAGYRIGPIQSEAFSAYLVDTGLLGIVLLAVNMVLTARNILGRENIPYRLRLFLLGSLLITLFWLPVSNIQDYVIYFMMFMPSGVLIQLAIKLDEKYTDLENK